MRILLYENRKSDPCLWDASTVEKERASYMALFKHFDKNWHFYEELEKAVDEDLAVKEELKLLEKVRIPDDHPMFAESEIKKRDLRKKLIDSRNAVYQSKLLIQARGGDVRSARVLLYQRRSYEMEWFDFHNAINPLEEE